MQSGRGGWTMINKQVVLGLMLLAVIGCRRSAGPTEEAKSAPSPAPAQHVDRAPATVVSYADVVERVAPSVVTIHSARRLRAPRQFPFFNDPRLGALFARFFCDP